MFCSFSFLFQWVLKHPYASTTANIILIRIMVPDTHLLLHPMRHILAISISPQKSRCVHHSQHDPDHPRWLCYLTQLLSCTLCGTVVQGFPRGGLHGKWHCWSGWMLLVWMILAYWKNSLAWDFPTRWASWSMALMDQADDSGEDDTNIW